jgi:acetyl-CoA acyltransferase
MYAAGAAAGCSAGLNDGATGCAITAQDVAAELGLDARMRLVDFGYAGVDPEVMSIGPVPATETVLTRNDLTIDDIGLGMGGTVLWENLNA